MAFAHGKGTEVLLDGVDVSVFLNAADTAIDVDTAETTAFKSAWKSFIAGTMGGKVDIGGMYDPADLTIRNTLTAAGTPVLSVAPAGATAIGAQVRLVPVLSTAYTESSPVGGVVALRWSVLAASGVGLGWSLHPLAEDTNTTTGAGRDDAAQTLTGWQAQLHVTAVDAGSWVVKLQDSADGSAWADVSGGAFAAATAAGGQRLVSAAGATLRRHVRYVATRTGGTAGDGITFALAYARNL